MIKLNFKNSHITLPALCVAAFVAAAVPAADATYMIAKANLAQTLIQRSWLDTGKAPWPWADTMPVARLVIPRLSVDSFVLAGAAGESLAFGPGMVNGSSVPGQPGVTMIAAHRDTHFKPLQNIKAHDLISIQGRDRQWHQYRVTSIGIADSRSESITTQPDDSRMVLVTCYPFDALTAGGPLRFVVEAILES